LTGGACQLAGTRELAQRVLNKQIRIGRPVNLPGLPAASTGPDYATAVGLLRAGATMPPESLNADPALKPPARGQDGFFRRFVGNLFG
jgi:cell division protein FtsA